MSGPTGKAKENEVTYSIPKELEDEIQNEITKIQGELGASLQNDTIRQEKKPTGRIMRRLCITIKTANENIQGLFQDMMEFQEEEIINKYLDQNEINLSHILHARYLLNKIQTRRENRKDIQREVNNERNKKQQDQIQIKRGKYLRNEHDIKNLETCFWNRLISNQNMSTIQNILKKIREERKEEQKEKKGQRNGRIIYKSEMEIKLDQLLEIGYGIKPKKKRISKKSRITFSIQKPDQKEKNQTTIFQTDKTPTQDSTNTAIFSFPTIERILYEKNGQQQANP